VDGCDDETADRARVLDRQQDEVIG